ncbi:MAG: methionine synthase [Actinobacteria bacterium]|uniref:Unannotated protein n=1 Tax=freshwater metagenome TaxID=449393 RepID=A0A6J6QEW2_9ZZZZ|nr:methionine synthase [Actinomycetota bacterium]
MTIATGIGSMPGEDQAAFETALRVVLDQLPDLPHLPEVPGRGAVASMTGRALAVVAGLGFDLQPAGWRLTDAAGVDHRRARSLLAQDLDGLEAAVDGYAGDFKIQLAGPWTLSATVEKPRGDKVLSDVGARRDLAQALAEGAREHLRDVRRRVPGAARLVVQVDEPALTAVLGGGVPTASGFGRHRTVHPPEASEHLSWLLAAIADEGGEPWVHSCAPDAPLQLLRGAGARALSVDLALMRAADHEVLGEALEAGESVVLGIVASLDPATPPSDVALAERVRRWLDMLGIDPESVAPQLLVSPTCGLAGASYDGSRRALALARTTAQALNG